MQLADMMLSVMDLVGASSTATEYGQKRPNRGSSGGCRGCLMARNFRLLTKPCPSFCCGNPHQGVAAIQDTPRHRCLLGCPLLSVAAASMSNFCSRMTRLSHAICGSTPSPMSKKTLPERASKCARRRARMLRKGDIKVLSVNHSMQVEPWMNEEDMYLVVVAVAGGRSAM